MFHHQDLEALLLQDYHALTKSEVMNKIETMLDLIQQTLDTMTQEYAAGTYNHNFKQTFKYLLKSYDFSLSDLQLQKDLVVHYREMMQMEAMILSKHMSELLDCQTFDTDIIKRHQQSISTLHNHIAHLSAVIKALKEVIQKK